MAASTEAQAAQGALKLAEPDLAAASTEDQDQAAQGALKLAGPELAADRGPGRPGSAGGRHRPGPGQKNALPVVGRAINAKMHSG